MYICTNCSGLVSEDDTACPSCGSQDRILEYRVTKVLRQRRVYEVTDANDTLYIARVGDLGEKRVVLDAFDFLPQILATFALKTPTPQHVTVMGRVDGLALSEYKAQTLELHTVLDILAQIFCMLRQIHEQGWLLGDISPDNFILGLEQKVYFVDVDALMYLSDTSESQLTQNTPGFAAPEQTGGRPLPASDVFAVGRLAVFLLTGRSPTQFYSESGFQWHNHVSSLSSQVLNFIDQLMANNPIDRPTVNHAIAYLEALPDRLRRESVWIKYKLPLMSMLSVVLLSVSFPLYWRARAWNLRIQADQRNLTGDVIKARELYERSLELNPHSASAHLGLALVCGDSECGINYLERALELEPVNKDVVVYNLAVLYEDIDVEKSISLYSILQSSRRSYYCFSQNNIGRLEIIKGNFNKAISILNALECHDIISANVEAKIYKNKGWAYYLKGDKNKATENLRESISLDPLYGDPYCFLWLMSGNRGEGLSCLSLDLVSPEARQIHAELLSNVVLNEKDE